MNSTFVSTIGTILGTILVILILGGIVAYALVRLWQKRTQEDLKKISSQSRQLVKESKNIRTALQGYSESDPPPFGPLKARILGQLNEFDEQMQVLLAQYGALQQTTRDINLKDLKSNVTAPFSWYHMRQKIANLLEKQSGAENALEAVHTTVTEIENQGWIIANQARILIDQMAKASQLLAHLERANIQSSSFDQAMENKQRITKALEGIPEFYLTGSEQSVISQSTKETVILVHGILAANQPDADNLVSLAETWRSQHKEANNGLEALQNLVNELRQILANMPSSLILTDAKTHLENAANVASRLNAGLTRPDIDDLPAHAQMAMDALADAQATYEMLNRAQHNHMDLSRLIANIDAGRDQLVANLAQLATRTEYPLAWNRSQVQLNDLLHRIEILGPINKPKTPEQLEKDLAMAKTLETRLKDLATRYQKAAAQYDELVPILSTLDLSTVQKKNQIAQRLASQVDEYYPENWPRQDAINHFRGDVDAFYNSLRTVVPENSSQALKETDLAQQLEQVRTLADQFQALQQREERIRARLIEIQAMENSAREVLSVTESALNQIGLLSNSNQTLKDTLAGEIERQLSLVDQLRAELNNKQKGLIQKKAQKINDFYNKIEQSSNNWLNKLAIDVKVKKGIIADKIERLREIADLSEPAIADAQKLLDSLDAGSGEGNKPGKKSRFSLSEIMLQFKFANESWQHSIASTRAIEDIETSVYDAYEKSEQQRHSAEDQLVQVDKLVQEARSWPPVSINLEAEHREFDDIERMRSAIRKEQPRAIWLVSRLGDLAIRYQSVADKVRHQGEIAAADHQRIRDLEQELEEAVRLWQYQKNTYSSNTLATANIQRLLSEISRDIDNLKRQYRQGIKNFSQVEQALKDLSRKATVTLIPVEDNQKIDINGEIRMERN